MKRLKITMALLFPVVLFSGEVAAQQMVCSAIAQKEYRQAFYQDYSRWSLGLNGGASVMWSDFRSFTADKTYLGFLGGLNLGYQITPTIGLSLSGEYGSNRLGATEHNKDRLLDRWGFTYNGAEDNNYAAYGDLYSKVESWHIGLSVDINVNNLLAGNEYGTRRWTVIASPGIYYQRFDPTVKLRSNNQHYATEFELNNNWNFALGGDLSLRFKASQCVDLALITGARWIDNQKFDGIASTRSIRNDGMAYVKLGVAFKLGAGRAKDHLMYAPTRRFVKYVMPESPYAGKEPEKIIVTKEVPVERVITKEVRVPDLAMPLPTVHFVRGNAVIDEVKYAAQLQNILAALRGAPDVKVQIWGYADHTGSDQINAKISLARAQALKDYLIRNGIDANRIVSIRGLGADPTRSGQAALSVEARRAEVVRD